MIYLKFLGAIASIGGAGYCVFLICARFCKDRHALTGNEQLVISFGFGTVLIGIEMFLMSLLHIRFSPLRILLLQAPLYSVFFVKSNTQGAIKHLSIRRERREGGLLSSIFVGLICFNAFYVMCNAVSLPFFEWDSWCNFGYNAKIFYLTKKIDPALLTASYAGIPHPDYPPAISLAEAYLYLFLGTIHEPLVKLWISCHYLFLIVVFYCVLRRWHARTLALGFTFMLSSIPQIISGAPTGYIDVAVTFYITAGILYFWLYLKEGKAIFLCISSVFLGLSMWVKNEALSAYLSLIGAGFLMWLIMPDAREAIVKLRKKLMLAFLAPFLIIGPWVLFRHYYHIVPAYFKGTLVGIPMLIRTRLPQVLKLLMSELMQVSHWNITWYLFIACCVLYGYHRREKMGILFIFIIFFQSLSYVLIYCIWPVPQEEVFVHILNSQCRVLIVLAPLALFFIAQQISAVSKRNC